MQNIPKIIHYCWFGKNPLPELAEKCIASWKKYCPDYQIIRWDESNFDVDSFAYTREAYDARKWAFVSDVARLCALREYGGIYLDTDMELLKPLDDLLVHSGFAGFESAHAVAVGIVGCRKENPMVKSLIDLYEEQHFVREDSSYDLTTIVERFTTVCIETGLTIDGSKQVINGFVFYPAEYFYPFQSGKEKLSLTNSSRSIHYYEGSWLSDEEKEYIKLRKKMMRFMPFTCARYIAKFITTMRYRGVSGVIQEIRK